MKKQLLVAMLYLYASMASAQLEVDTNGNVGIKQSTSFRMKSAVCKDSWKRCAANE